MNVIEQANLYINNNYYHRERRKFRGRWWWPKKLPNTDGLKPEASHLLLGDRDTWLDKTQSVFGYFFGGGWIYGLVENTTFRALSSGLTAYENTPDSRNGLSVGFRAGALVNTSETGRFDVPDEVLPDVSSLPIDSYLSITVERDRLEPSSNYPILDPAPLPSRAALRTIDLLAVEHDRALRERDEKGWDGTITKGDARWRELSSAANQELLDQLRELSWANMREELKDNKADLVAMDHWEEMVSLTAYECYVSGVAIAGLMLNDVLQGFKDAVLCPPPESKGFMGRDIRVKATQSTAPEMDVDLANAEIAERYDAAKQIKQEAEDFFSMENM